MSINAIKFEGRGRPRFTRPACDPTPPTQRQVDNIMHVWVVRTHEVGSCKRFLLIFSKITLAKVISFQV